MNSVPDKHVVRTRLLTALVWICGAMYFAWINSQLEVVPLDGIEDARRLGLTPEQVLAMEAGRG